jgi:S1-C subfamily serine protease
MPKGAVSTPAVPEVTVLVINQQPVKNIQELKQILDTLAPGQNVAITFQSQGKNLAIEGVVKQK